MPKIGQRFYRDTDTTDIYILAQVGSSQVALIELDSGNRWGDWVYVELVGAITKDEWVNIRENTPFTLVGNL